MAELFGVQPRTVRRWALDGLLHRVHVGGITRYRRSDIEALIAPPNMSESPAGEPSSRNNSGVEGAGHVAPRE